MANGELNYAMLYPGPPTSSNELPIGLWGSSSFDLNGDVSAPQKALYDPISNALWVISSTYQIGRAHV